MKTIPAETFDKFIEIVENQRKFDGKLIWRGQSNAIWPLKTSLERFLEDEEISKKKSYSFSKFYNVFCGAMPFIKSFSELNFVYEINNASTQTLSYSTFEEIKEHYWNDIVLLRHYGFPSFLLDWTESHWIALYFAFEPSNDSEHRVVYVHKVEDNKEEKDSGSSCHIKTIEGFANERRHIMQQCWLSCAYEEINTKEQNIIPYEEAIKKTNKENDFVRIKLPSNIREKVLKRLSEQNINHFTLFGNAEAVIRTAALKYFNL